MIMLPLRGVSRQLQQAAVLKDAVRALCSAAITSHAPLKHPGRTPNTSVSDALEDDSHLMDLTSPASWYPVARGMKRTIIAHMGPTNSGKTYQALQALKAANSGVYCGPLRLLAWEVAEKMNSEGLLFSLITGQERREIDGARHVASTVEMASTSRPVEVGVIDEVQMVGDPSRGASFTRAVLGLPAQYLHVCGDPAALPLLKLLAREAGDNLEVRTYERLAPLVVSRRAVPSLSPRRGDCLVAFSRRDVHGVKRHVEGLGNHSCCVVYGALPPESRAQQAVLFNTARTGYNVLAASDAVGMGLNLNIRRIVFTALDKYDGTEQRMLTPAEVKQIAGRAGRYGSRYEGGEVTCMNKADMAYLRVAMAEENPEVRQACLFPRYEQIAMLVDQQGELTLPSALQAFADRAVMAEHYFLGDHENVAALAQMLTHLDLTLREHYVFSISPTDATDQPAAAALLSFVSMYCKRGSVPGRMCGHPPGHVPHSEAQLSQLEASHRIYDLYIWLTWRLEDAFPDRALVEGWRAQCSELIRKGLERMSRGRATPSRVSRQRSRLHASPIAEPCSQVDILAAAGAAALNIPPTSGPRGLATASGPSSSWGSTTTRRLGNGCAASGVRGYSKATVRHFPKHLVPKPGEAPRPVVPDAAQKDLETYDKYDLDPKAPLVFPERPAETRQQRRVRKREEGQLRVVERDFGEGILPPFRNHDPVEPVLPHFGPSLQPKRKKKSAKRHSSGSRPFPTS